MRYLLACMFLFCFVPSIAMTALIPTSADSITKTDFVMTKFFANNGRSFKSFGNAMIAAKEGICWQVKKPIERRWLINQKAVIEFGKDGSQKLVSTDEDGMLSFMSTTFAALLAQNEEKLESSFSIIRNQDKQEIYLRPKQEPLTKVIFSINISFDGNFVKRIKIIELNNSYTNLEFINQNTIGYKNLEGNFCHE
jgi:hypothetical protein